MPRPSTKEQIIVSALETLHSKGFNGSSVEDITSGANVPKGSFYNHFKSKEELAVTALDQYWQRVLSSLDMLNDIKKTLFMESYRAEVQGTQVQAAVWTHRNAKGETDSIMVNHYPLEAALLFSRLLWERVGDQYRDLYLSGPQYDALQQAATR